MKIRRIFSVLATGMLVLAGCSNTTDTGGGEAGSSGKTDAVVAVNGDIQSLDPTVLSTAFTSGGDRAVALYGSLMKYDTDGRVIPAMAESLESDDLATWTLTLRDGVKFSDGTPYDAEAVVFNLERITAEDSTSPAKSLLAGLASIEVVDSLTVKFTLAAPSGSFASLFTSNTTLGYIASPTALKAGAEEFNANPIGAGPFMVTEWVRDSHVAMVKSETYWDADNVKLESIRYNIIPDALTKTQALATKSVDVIPLVEGTQWIQFKDDPEFTIYQEGSLGAQSFYPNLQMGAMKDLEVRRAIQMGFDPSSSNEILNANAITWDGNHDCIPFTPDTAACAPGIYPDANVDEAKKIIADYISNGGDATIRMLFAQGGESFADYFGLVLADLGFDVTPMKAGLSDFASATREGNYEVIIAPRLPFVDPFPAFFNQISSTGSNYTKQDDTEFQTALEAARDAGADDKDAAWGEVNRQIAEKAYAFWVTPSSYSPVSVSTFHPGNSLSFGAGGVWYPADAYFD